MTDDPARDVRFDHDRVRRIGLPEAVFSEGKSTAQLEHLIDDVAQREGRLLLTRLFPEAHAVLGAATRGRLDYDETSATAFVGTPMDAGPTPLDGHPPVAIVTAGTVDLPPAREAERTLTFHGVESTVVADVGVAGLWRLLERIDEIAAHPVIIAVAGMEAALFSVLGGLVPGAVIAVPTSHGYGVAENGRLALHAALSGCSSGVVACNIDNGYGAACAALRILGAMTTAAGVAAPLGSDSAHDEAR